MMSAQRERMYQSETYNEKIDKVTQFARWQQCSSER